MGRWDLRCTDPPPLVRPVRIDPTGRSGPTRSQAYGPRWRRTGQGLFVPAAVDRGVVEQRILEEWAALPPGAVVSGWAALRLHGGNFFDGRDDRLAELPVPAVLPPRTNTRAPGVERHRDRIPPGEVVLRHGIRCATPARALFDAIRWSDGLRAAVVAADMALAPILTTPAALRAYVDRRCGERGSLRARQVLEYVEPRTRSPQESAMRLVWRINARLPRPRCNWPVGDERGRWIGEADLLCEHLAVVGEYDGADHRGARRRSRDIDKEQRYRNAGLECFRVVGGDLDDTDLVVGRMRDAVRRAAEARRPARWTIRDNPRPL